MVDLFVEDRAHEEFLLPPVEALYRRFFCRMRIDPETGTTRLQADRKFAAYPYIGSKYGTDPDVKRLLVVGRDIGSDETPGRLQHFEERRRAIECTPLPSLNPHIAGTYFTALRYAFPGQEWDRVRDRDQTCQAILKDGYALRNNPLSYIALTNFYKWVTIGRRNKGGAHDCKLVDPRRERELFLEEVRLLVPHIVVFQGAGFDKPPVSASPRCPNVRGRVARLGASFVAPRSAAEGHHAAAAEQHGSGR